MSDTFSEYGEITVTAPLRQGDVLEAVDPEASRWQRHLLVITADCDFAHDKHYGRVTCVPLLTAEEYLLEMHIPRLRERYISSKLLPALRRATESGRASKVSDERLRAWPQEAKVEDIVSSLGLGGSAATEATAAFQSIRLLADPCATLDDAVLALTNAQLTGPNAQKRENIVKGIADALKAPFSQPPGDAIFFSAIGPTHDIGYFAYLRHLEPVRQPDIAIGPSRHGVRYRRISHLQDRYTHAAVQRFALVFMSIGLPQEYEDMRDLHSELLGDKYK